MADFSGFYGEFFSDVSVSDCRDKVSSSIAGIINSMMPIFVIIVGALIWKFETTKKQLIGTLISFSGVCLLAFGGDGEGGKFKLIPILLLLLATFCYALSTTTVKSSLWKFRQQFYQLLFGFVLFFPSLIALTFTGFFRHSVLMKVI
jgi:drug/metabolite transporter (DMT)-like permease